MTPLVLLADDAEDVLEAHGEILSDAGYRVACARDGREAVEKAIALRPDVILMDLQMPGIDGWEATRLIRSDLRTHHIPIIAFTGHGLRRYADRSFDAGCTSFLEKPCSRPALLVEEVRRALARRTPFGAVVEAIGDQGSGAHASAAHGSGVHGAHGGHGSRR
ncbi:MAG TPA: response regulator [Polyangia bacterium]|nr:response regulator [Polyangia bacterium]